MSEGSKREPNLLDAAMDKETEYLELLDWFAELPEIDTRFDNRHVRHICFKVISNRIVKTFLEEEYGITELHIVCRLGEVQLVNNFVEHGANVNAKINSNSPICQGYTALHCTVERAAKNHCKRDLLEKLEEIVRVLVKHGADVLSANDNNETPFNIWYQYHDSYKNEDNLLTMYPFLMVLFSGVTNFKHNLTDSQGLSLFHIACMTANVDIVGKFLIHGVDVNQSISHFSKVCPGTNPLHMLIKYWKFDLSNEAFLQILDMLLKSGANINATDAFGNTPLHDAIALTVKLRRFLIEKLIRNGADVEKTNVYGNTSFRLLLRCDDASYEEIDLFLDAGCNFNIYHPITEKGYMAMYFRELKFSHFSMKKNLLDRIINNPKIVVNIDESGRTALHNMVSISYYDKFPRGTAANKAKKYPIYYVFRPRQLLHKTVKKCKSIKDKQGLEVKYKFYRQLIKQLLILGCDIDHQDNEGKTALHYSVAYRNHTAFIELLENGADINICDKNGKVPFDYCQHPSYCVYERYCINPDIYYNRHFAGIFNEHLYKLEFCKLRVNKQNKYLQDEVLDELTGKAVECFHDEMNKKNFKIKNTSISIYEFLTNENIEIIYWNMTNEERWQVDQFVKNIEQYNFPEINYLVKLKYKKTIERKKLFHAALTSLNFLLNYQLPELVGRFIFEFLTNEELKRLALAS